MNERYERWNAAIADAYFSPAEAGRPVYLSVDDDELENIASQAGLLTEHLPAEDLAAAVRAELAERGFGRFSRGTTGWRTVRDTPPYIALLAFCVLAGSRMEADETLGIHSNDYYARLNQLLGRDLFADQPPAFELMKVVWNDLAKWLDQDLEGERGRSTVRTHTWFVHIGYPLSQCALRARDRHRLPDFFRSAGLEPGDQISDNRLGELLRAWASRPSCGLSGNGQGAVLSDTDSARFEAVVAIVQRELRAWDGSMRDATGRRRADMVLVLELRKGKPRGLRLFAPCPDGFPDHGTWTETTDGGTLTLSAKPTGWYGEVAVPNVPRLLKSGMIFLNGRFALAYEPDSVVPLKKDFAPESGWVSTRRVEMFHEHAVLARRAHRDELHSYFAECAVRTPTPLAVDETVAKDWDLWIGAELTRFPHGAVPHGLERLVPRFNTATQVEGGLRLGKNLYLTGGEPDIFVTVGPGETCELVVDGGEPTLLQEGAAELRLSALGLDANDHVVQAAGRTVRFRSIDTFHDVVPDQAGGLAHRIEHHSHYKPTALIATEALPEGPPLGTLEICGAHVLGDDADKPSAPAPPVVMRTGFARYCLLGAEAGQVETCGPQPKPSWLGDLTFQFFERTPCFAAQIQIRTSTQGKKSVRPIASEPCPARRDQPWSEDAAREWAALILQAHAAEPDVPEGLWEIWRSYVSVAELVTRELGR